MLVFAATSVPFEIRPAHNHVSLFHVCNVIDQTKRFRWLNRLSTFLVIVSQCCNSGLDDFPLFFPTTPSPHLFIVAEQAIMDHTANLHPFIGRHVFGMVVTWRCKVNYLVKFRVIYVLLERFGKAHNEDRFVDTRLVEPPV